MLIPLLVANLLHGLVALVWTAGLKRLLRPVSPVLWSHLLGISLVLPVLVGLAHLADTPTSPEPFAIVRSALWGELALRSGYGLLGATVLLLAGTVAIFVLQELLPAWSARRGRLHAARTRDARLDDSLARCLDGFRARQLSFGRGRVPRVARLETDRAVAALDGMVAPVVLISSGLMARLDDEELDAAIAHELAHLVRGGPVTLLLIWLCRALQAASPAALVISRDFFAAEEAACDAIAAQATGKRAALASVLLKARGPLPAARTGGSAWARAQHAVRRSAAVGETAQRVRALLDDDAPTGAVSRTWLLAAALLLGSLLWTIA